jgi:hypothetical protein
MVISFHLTHGIAESSTTATRVRMKECCIPLIQADWNVPLRERSECGSHRRMVSKLVVISKFLREFVNRKV